MSAVFRTATKEDLQRLLALMDAEFIFGKGRTISLAQRRPALFSATSAQYFQLVEDTASTGEPEIVAALVAQAFEFVLQGDTRRGAMIGLVLTLPARRGEGWASQLLRHTVETLRQQGLDFAVLWTAQPAFYARLGWQLADRGVFGELDLPHANAMSGFAATTPIAQADTGWIESLRQQYGAPTRRAHSDYLELPPNVEQIDVLSSGDAYALLGHAGATAVLYEMQGNAANFAALWQSILASGYRRLWVNDVAGSTSQRWLQAHTAIDWQPKPLAMWLSLTNETLPFADAYVPYFDRI